MNLIVLGSITFGWHEKSKLYFSVRSPPIKHSPLIFTIFDHEQSRKSYFLKLQPLNWQTGFSFD